MGYRPGGIMEALLSPEDYIEFERRRDILKEKGINLNHSVEHIDGKYSIKLNSNYDLTELDKLTDV